LKLPGLRWYIIVLLFFATVSNYIDRQTVNVLSPLLLAELGLNKVQFSQIAVAFLAAYTIGQTLWGRIFDRIGLRLGLTLCIGAWSLVASLHYFAAGFASFLLLRFLLGVTEAGNWPGAGKIISEWFPPHERAFAMGVFNNGSGVGAMVAPPVIIAVQQLYGWQKTFLITGVLGFAWLLVWSFVYRRPDRHPWLGERERAALLARRPQAAVVAPPPPFRELFRHRETWAVVVARFIADPIWWIYLTWLPQYLFDERKFDLKQIGAFAWVPYLAADLGALAGGLVSGWLIKRGVSIDRSRKACFIIGTSILPVGAFVPWVASAASALALIAVVLFAYQFWVNNVQAVTTDVFPSRMVGGVFGLGGTAAGLGSLLVLLMTGYVVQYFSYTPIFIAAAAMGPLAAVAMIKLVGRIPPQPKELPAR
jgi:MFS transporter, ACS family, hexuronate transporter